MDELQKHSESSSKQLLSKKEKTFNSKSSTDSNSFVSIGILSTSHGVKGWAKVRSAGDSWNHLKFPLDLKFQNQDNTRIHKVLEAEPKPDYILIRVESVDNPEYWIDWRGAKIYLESMELDPISLDDESFFYYQLEGLKVLDEDGNDTGFTVGLVEETSAHEILILHGMSRTILVPFVKEWVGDISIPDQTIVVMGWENWLAL